MSLMERGCRGPNGRTSIFSAERRSHGGLQIGIFVLPVKDNGLPSYRGLQPLLRWCKIQIIRTDNHSSKFFGGSSEEKGLGHIFQCSILEKEDKTIFSNAAFQLYNI